MSSRQTGYTQETSAAKSGISVRSSRHIEKNERPEKKTAQLANMLQPF